MNLQTATLLLLASVTLSSTSNLQQPSTSSIQQPSSSNLQQPSTSNLQQPSTSNLQQPSIYNFYVEEEAVAGIVGCIPFTISSYSKVVFNYQLTENLIKLTKHNATTSCIEMSAKTDRETLPANPIRFVIENMTSPGYPITNVTSPGYPVVEVNVYVTDINDNSPRFHDNQTVFISESAIIGYEVLLESALDMDEGTNGLMGRYEISEGDVEGRYEISTGDVGKKFGLRFMHEEKLLYLIVEGKLDREKVASYGLTLDAYDLGE